MNSRLAPVDLSTLQDRIYESLKLTLLTGQLLPGEAISLRELAKDLGTSPMPVRDAVKRLVAEKALIQSSDRVIRVVPYIPDSYERHIRIRTQVEGFAAERACLSRDPTLIEHLTEHNLAMLNAARSGDVEAMLSANQGFHFTVYEAANDPQLLEMIEILWLRTGPFVATAKQKPLESVQMFETGVRAHKRLIDAIARRDLKGARFALALDIRSATKWLRRHYDFAE